MSGLVTRRVTGVVTALVWPACRIIESITHPPWGNGLSDAVAPLVAIVMLSLAVTNPAAHRHPRHARTAGLTMELVLAHLSHLSVGVGDLCGRMERCEARQERTDARLDCALQVINETNEEAGYSAPDIDDTMPGTRKLRAVPRLRAQRETG